jgi:hypothetical protein
VHITSHHLENPETFLMPASGPGPRANSFSPNANANRSPTKSSRGRFFKTVSKSVSSSIPGLFSFTSVSDIASQEGDEDGKDEDGDGKDEDGDDAHTGPHTFTALSEIKLEHLRRNLPAGGFGKRYSVRGEALGMAQRDNAAAATASTVPASPTRRRMTREVWHIVYDNMIIVRT